MQEIYGLLLGHWAVRSLIFQVASNASISPLRLSFTGTLRVVRRARRQNFRGYNHKNFPFFKLAEFGDSRAKYTGKSERETTQES